MSKKFKAIILIIVFVLLVACAYVLYQQLSKDLASSQLIVHTQPATASTDPSETSPTEKEEPIQFAPNFLVYDVDGNKVHLSDYIGKPIVLNFWASWCGPCKMEMPDFNEKYLEMGTDIQFLMINMTDGARETVDVAASFIDSQGYTFPVFYDTAGNAAMIYGVYSLPTTYFINAQGHLIAQAMGAIDAETLQTGIDLITSD